MKLRLTMWDNDILSKDDFMGECTVPLGIYMLPPPPLSHTHARARALSLSSLSLSLSLSLSRTHKPHQTHIHTHIGPLMSSRTLEGWFDLEDPENVYENDEDKPLSGRVYLRLKWNSEALLPGSVRPKTNTSLSSYMLKYLKRQLVIDIT
jgi:hypothetical protein